MSLRRFMRPLGWKLGRLFSAQTRNVAIIAHVDHGKTTMVDCLLRQSGALEQLPPDARLMDSNVFEKERGITILSKCTSIAYDGFHINVVDTPGHADFGGEVERALAMVDGVVLVVDATEGPMAQTKFVLAKALHHRLAPIVVFNKVDRPSARCDEVDSEVFDLFSSLGATDQQLEYPTVYASAREGWGVLQNPWVAGRLSPPPGADMTVLLRLIASHVPPPRVDANLPFRLLVSSIEPNQFVGRCSFGKVQSGRVRIGDQIRGLDPEGRALELGKVTKMFIRRGLDQINIESAQAGDIVTLAGLNRVAANFTVCSPEVADPLPIIPIDPPTVAMVFTVNNSPLSGREGKLLTGQQLYDRLRLESENNIAIQLRKTAASDAFEVSGRGELQMSILVETLRREGHEFAISPPKVVMKRDPASGQVLEPIMELTVDCPLQYSGTVIENLSKRKGILTHMHENGDKTRMAFTIPMRGLIGYASENKNDTHGTGVLNYIFVDYEPFKGPIEGTRKGSLISMADGVVTAYALLGLESRGTMFVEPGTKVYPGMVVGECSRNLDIDVNPCRSKVLTNVRSTVKEEFVRLAPSRLMSLEEMIAYISEDEMIEITPQAIRLRKKELDSGVRRAKKSKQAA